MDKTAKILEDLVFQLFNIEKTIRLSRPEPQFGDFSTNIAMQISKDLNKSSLEIAETLVEEIKKSGEFSEVSVAGPGFINLRINASTLSSELTQIIDSPSEYGKSKLYQDKVVVVEYSDPNPFKVLHIGHLYTSVVGDAISNLIEHAGGQVHRVNFGGDVGLHVGKTMWAILKRLGGEFPEKLSEIDDNSRSEWMASCYVEGTQSYESDEKAKLEIISLNKKIYQFHNENDHTSATAQIYWTCRDWSYEYFNKFYDRIGTKFEKYYPESKTSSLGLQTVIEQKNKGIYKGSDGAVIFEGEPFGLHTRVFINKEGLPTYEAKDVGLIIKKWDDYKFDQSVIITGNDVIEYMRVVLKSIEQFRPELVIRTRHVTHGNVKLPGGVKMASRKGNFLKATDVLDIIADENEAAQGNRNEEPVLGAIKYAFLKNKIGADIIFDPKESVSLQGNSGPYLQYALVRATSIVKKAALDDSKNNLLPDDYSQYERSLLIKITEYSDVIAKATLELMPHYLCTYLYELAQEFNRFYENSRVVGDEREQIRLHLIGAYVSVLKNGLIILGIPIPERM